MEIETETDRENLIILIRNMELGSRVEIKKKKKGKRTLTQNAALHKYCELLAVSLNDAGLDMRLVLRNDIDIPWTMENAKEHLWRPIQRSVTRKDSTTQASTADYSGVHNVLSRHLSEKLGVYVPWPSLRG